MTEHPIEIDGIRYTGTTVSMGNPHLVIFVNDITKVDLSSIGPKLENHPLFPDRTNVEFAQVLEEGGMVNKTTGNITVNNQLRWKVIDGLQLVGQAVIRKYDQDENVTNKKIINYDWDNNEVRGETYAE